MGGGMDGVASHSPLPLHFSSGHSITSMSVSLTDSVMYSYIGLAHMPVHCSCH